MIVRKIHLKYNGQYVAEYRSYTIPRDGETVVIDTMHWVVKWVAHHINKNSRNEDNLADVILHVEPK